MPDNQEHCLSCGLPEDELMALRNATALNRLTHAEALAIFDRLVADGFRIVRAESPTE